MLNFGIIGIGRMGVIHAQNIYSNNLKGVILKAVCDNDINVLNMCASKFPLANAYLDYKEMILKEKLDGVIVATPHYSHKEIAEYLIENNINTLVEKPLYPNVCGADEIIKKSNMSSCLLGVSYNQRSNPLYKKTKDIIKSDIIGKINYANFTITSWYRSQCYYDQNSWRGSFTTEGGGALINQCVHQIDILVNLLGLPNSINGKCKIVNRNITVENDVFAILKYNDFNCNLLVSNHELGGKTEFEIVGNKGKLVINETKMSLYTHKDETMVNNETTSGYGETEIFTKKYTYGKQLVRDNKLGQQLRSLENFRDAINKKDNLLAPINEGINALEIINAIYLSSEFNKEILLPVDRKQYIKFLNKKMEEEKNVRR